MKRCDSSSLAMLIVCVMIVQSVAASSEIDAAKSWLRESLSRTDKLPFSFCYNNLLSLELLNKWQKKEQSKRIDEQRTAKTQMLTDPVTGLQVRFEAIEYQDYPVVEWIVYFKNAGKVDTPILEDIQALDINVSSPQMDPILHYHQGATCRPEDFKPFQRVMNPGATVSLHPGAGRSSSEYMPFFNLQKSENEGIIIALGWTGEWAAEFNTDYSRRTRIRNGLALTHLKLLPGEEIRSPRMVLLFYNKGRMSGQNLLRRFILSHNRPLINGEPFDLPTFVFYWGGTPAHDHLANIQATFVDHDLPFDYYWIDAEWYGKGLWQWTVGDWRIKRDLYPDGIRPISDAVHKAGRKFSLWFEPERVCPGTPWYEEIHKYLLFVPQEKKFSSWEASHHEPYKLLWESRRNQIKDNDGLINLGNAEARKFLTDYVSDRIVEYGLDIYRHDANIGPLEFWRAADKPDRQGITEIRWVEGLYAYWDGLLARHPNLIIDNCASGGRRIDIETIRRTTPFTRTDWPIDPIAMQAQTFGISHWIPLNSTITAFIKAGKSSDYEMQSSYSSTICWDMFGNAIYPQPRHNRAEWPWDNTRRQIQQFRSIQKYFTGDYYPLTLYSLNEDAWMAWQFNRPDLNEGLIQVFRRPASICETGKVRLFGLDAHATYTIANQDAASTIHYSGQTLMEQGLPLEIEQQPGSLLLVYKKKG